MFEQKQTTSSKILSKHQQKNTEQVSEPESTEDTAQYAMETSCRLAQKTGQLSDYCLRSCETSSFDNTMINSLASPLTLRTDLNLDHGLVDSPLFEVPVLCSNDKVSDSTLTSYTELTPVIVPKRPEKVDFTDLITKGTDSIATTGPSSVTDVTTSGNISISIATADPVSIIDVIATEKVISIASAEPISVPIQISDFVRPVHSVPSVSNSLDINKNVIFKTNTYCNNNEETVLTNMLTSHIVNNTVFVDEKDRSVQNIGSNPKTSQNNKQATKKTEQELAKTDDNQSIKPIKRKRNRRKPDPDEPPLSPPITVLPPCAICGSKSSGFHYGANTCEACKGFFRRTLKKNEVKFQCCCTEEEKGERRQDGGVGKNTCPACRYQQCLAVGMSRNAIKIGRYSIQRKTKNICYVKTLEGEEDVGIYEKFPGSSSVSDTSPSANSDGSGVSVTNSPNDFEMTLPIGAFKDAPPEKKIKLSGEITLKEVDTYVKTLYHAFKRLLEEPRVFQDAEINRRQNDYLEQYTLKRELFGLERPISREEYFELYNSTGIELDNRKEHITEAVQYFEEKISKLVEFAKCIPGFRELSLQDQAKLIKAARIECGLLSCQNKVFLNRDTNVTTTPWGKQIHLDEVENIGSKEFILEKYKAVQKARSLDLSTEEEAVLAALILTYTDRCELSDPDKVQNIQYKLLTCLEYLIQIRPTNKPNKLGRIFSFLIGIRNVSEWEAEIIKQISLDWPSVISVDKMESAVIWNLGASNGSD